MSTSPMPTPPRLARFLLRRVLPEDVRDIVDGDLHELYVSRLAASGGATAALWYWWYWWQAISFSARFTVDRIARFLGDLAAGTAMPSTLDMRLGKRMLVKSPGLAIVGGLGMAVAVALGAGAYAVINSYFYPELPLQDGDRVVAIGKFDRARRIEYERLLHDFLIWRHELRSVVDVGAFRTIRRNFISQSGVGEPITLAEMTAAGFRVARVPPLYGRTLVDADEQPGANAVVVIGYDAWQSRFAGDSEVIGRRVRIGQLSYTIVGIMPQGFAFPINHQYWIPLRIDSRTSIAPGAGPDLDVFARLAPTATKQTAQAELTVLAGRIAADGPTELAKLESRIVPYTDIFVHAEAEGEAGTMAVLRFLIALLLVIVATNVAVLVYARTVARTQEIAVRTALGATRGRIVGQLFTEALVLSGLAALLGLGIVAIALRMFDRALSDWFEGHPPFWIHSGLSSGTVLYALALAVLAAVIVGVFPALRATGARLRATIGSLGSGATSRLGPTWTALIVAQVTITVALLPTAMLKGWQTVRMALERPGFATSEYLSARFAVERDTETSDAHADSSLVDSTRAILSSLVARLATEPGVVGASVSSDDPWGGTAASLDVEGAPMPPERVRVSVVDANYFGLFGVRLLAGRTMTLADAALPPPARPVIVNRSFAAELLGAGDPIGRRVRYRSYNGPVNPWLTIVGVVEDFPLGVKTPGFPITRTMYCLTVPGELSDAKLAIRFRGQSPDTFAPTLRRIATSVSPMLQLSDVSTLEANYRDDFTIVGARLAAVVLLIVGSVLLLSAAGIHALMSFTVNQRRREIGIRTAIGAPLPRIVTSILSRAARQLALGVGIGLTVAFAGDQLSGNELMGGSGLLLIPATAAFMLVIGFLAASGPVRRGLRVDPTEALRAE